MSPNKLLNNFKTEFEKLLSFFPDPFVQETHQNTKIVFIIEHEKARKKMDNVLIKLQKLLTTKLNTNQYKSILKQWKELQILKTFYIKRFDTKDVYHSSIDE